MVKHLVGHSISMFLQLLSLCTSFIFGSLLGMPFVWVALHFETLSLVPEMLLMGQLILL